MYVFMDVYRIDVPMLKADVQRVNNVLALSGNLLDKVISGILLTLLVRKV